MTQTGNVTLTVPAGLVHDAAGNANLASTTTDNSVYYDITPPTVTINQAAHAGRPDRRHDDQLHRHLQRRGHRLCQRRSFDRRHRRGHHHDRHSRRHRRHDLQRGRYRHDPKRHGDRSVPAGVAQDLAGYFNVASTSTDNTVTST